MAGQGGGGGHLVFAFSSLGNGLVWHKFNGSLALVNRKQTRRSVQAVDECYDHCHTGDEDDNNNGNDSGAFDVLFFANPLQSWYQKDNNDCFGRYAHYKSRIRAALQPYSHISLVGDSMGGSTALLFSHLATNAVVAFSPQVDLERDTSHVGRSNINPGIWRKICNMLYHGFRLALDVGVDIIGHWGSEESDV
jgi:hypothetical protein